MEHGAVNVARRQGQTLEMVKHLPDNAIVVVHRPEMRRYVLEMIRDVRGVEFAKKCNVAAVSKPEDLWSLRGTDRPFRVDHAVFDSTPDTRNWQDVRFKLQLILDHQGV